MNIFNHRHISSRQQQDPLSRRIWNDPYLDWSIMLACVAILSAAITFVGYGIYLNTHSRLEAPLDSTITVDQSAVDAKVLSKVLTDFNDRSAKKAEIIRGVGVPSDPSI